MPNVYTPGSHFPLPNSSQNFLRFGYIQWYASKVCSPHVATSSLWASSRYVLFIIICSSSSYWSLSICICWMTDLLTNNHKIDSGFHGQSYFSLTMVSCNPFQQPFSEWLSSRGPLRGLGCVHLETAIFWPHLAGRGRAEHVEKTPLSARVACHSHPLSSGQN